MYSKTTNIPKKYNKSLRTQMIIIQLKPILISRCIMFKHMS